MKIAVIGATGNAGSRLLAELVRRGHSVTALVRNPERVPTQFGVTAKRVDATDKAKLIEALAGHDAIISAVPFASSNPRILIEAVKAARGGALSRGGRRGQPGGRTRPEARGCPRLSGAIPGGSPCGCRIPGRLASRAGTRLDIPVSIRRLRLRRPYRPVSAWGDQLLADEKGNSTISFEDFAIAMSNELEQPAHSRQRFTVGY